jgi:hypothetical protein
MPASRRGLAGRITGRVSRVGERPHPGARWRRTMQRTRGLGRIRWAFAASFLVAAGGCTSVKMTGTARTGTEQLLLTGTWDDALCRVDFRTMADKRIFVDGTYLSGVVDKDYVVSSLRRVMAEQGVLLESNKDKAQIILEPSFGAYGTDMRDTQVGLPGMALMPSLLTGATAVASSGNSNSMNLSQTNREDAVVKAILYAYDAKSGRLVWESGWLLNAQGVRDHFVMGSGPYRMSSRGEVERYPDEAQVQTRKRFLGRVLAPLKKPKGDSSP